MYNIQAKYQLSYFSNNYKASVAEANICLLKRPDRKQNLTDLNNLTDKYLSFTGVIV